MKAAAKAWGFWAGSILLWEAVLHGSAFQSWAYIWLIAALSVGAAGILAVLAGLPGWAGRLCGGVLLPVLFVLYGVQLVYHDIFGSFLSLAFVSMGGEAITAFWPIALAAVGRCLPRLLLMAVPLLLFYPLRRRGFFSEQGWRERVSMLACAALLIGVPGISVVARQTATTVDRWAEQFGILTAEALDLKKMITGASPGIVLPDNPDNSDDPARLDSELWNVMPELDFSVLEEQTEDGTIQSLNAYFAAQSATAKNEFTGYFEGYNLIVICAEAFSPYLIDEELTPTLYRLSHEGVIFQNFYNSFPNLTTNGEYTLCMGLMPDLSRMSFSASANNYVPFCLGNVCAQAGMTSVAYHNNVASFYNRIKTHPNMGYDFKAIELGLDMEKANPTSDLEMMEKTVDEYLGQEPFHAYYMTYSGHANYGFDVNAVSAKNEALVEGMEGSETLRAYYACQLELERAVAYLVERLEEAGIAERTVIVLTGDHMPYGLPEEDYAQMAGDAVDEPFWKYRNSFICWNGGMEEPVVVEDYCCTQDILPTLLNLFGFSYDSRLLTGRDVLSDCEHVAVLKDGSFLTDGLLYNASTGELIWEDEPDEEYGQSLIRRVENQFAVSAAILDKDYYDFVFSALGLRDEDGPNQQQEPSYLDTVGTWYEDAVETLVKNGVLNGVGNGTFQGEREISRGEFVTFLTRGLRLAVVNAEPPYTDLKNGAWYVDPVISAWDAGFFPEGETQFRPYEMITWEEAREILARAAEYMGIADGESWAAEAMAIAWETQGDESGEIVTRGETAFIVVRLAKETGVLS